MVTNSEKRARALHGTQAVRGGAGSPIPPHSNTGGTDRFDQGLDKHQMGANQTRERLNLSLGPELKTAVEALSRVLGMSESQLVVHALLMSLSVLQGQANAVLEYSGRLGDAGRLDV